MPKNLHKEVSIKDFWNGIYPIDLSTCSQQKSSRFVRFSLDNLNAALGDVLSCNKLDSVLRSTPTIVSDSGSLEHLLALSKKTQHSYKCPGESGWIYIFSNIAEIYLGQEIDKFLFWKTIRYESRLKIGRTFRHPIQRIHEQSASEGHSRAIIPLGLFWSPKIVIDDQRIGSRLAHKNLNDTPGIEWFNCSPELAIDEIMNVLQQSRAANPVELNITL
jgi:hypothetical protein